MNNENQNQQKMPKAMLVDPRTINAIINYMGTDVSLPGGIMTKQLTETMRALDDEEIAALDEIAKSREEAKKEKE